jgi:hypothetical protein
MDANLIGYLLNALDPEERQEVEQALAAEPALRDRLEQLERCLAPLAADAAEPEPPAGLVLRTIAYVAEQTTARPALEWNAAAALISGPAVRGGDQPSLLRLPDAPAPSPSQWAPPRQRAVRWADLFVAACLLIFVGGVASPWLVGQWHAQQVQNCKANLSSFWTSLQAYSDNHDGRYPQVQGRDGALGYAGSFVPVLKDAGVLPPNVQVNCPAVGAGPLPTHSVADLEALAHGQPEELRKVMRTLVPGYAYSLGFEDGGRLYGPHRGLGDLNPLLADRPTDSADGNSLNHHGKGQNVLYIGGNVRWCVNRHVGEEMDDIYLNRCYERRAGLDRADTVLGPSDSRPR